MSSNKHIKDKMIAKYGPECWIEKLHLRPDTESRKYTSKGQYKRMKQLTYHHILEKRKGGQATEENGALLSVENHAWFHRQPPEVQHRLNEIFQEYKRQINLSKQNDAIFIKSIVDNMSYDIFITRAKKSYNRAKEKRKIKELLDDELDIDL